MFNKQTRYLAKKLAAQVLRREYPKLQNLHKIITTEVPIGATKLAIGMSWGHLEVSLYLKEYWDDGINAIAVYKVNPYE